MTLASTPRYDPDQITSRDDSAVVVGGSMAGLLAARVLADAFDSVTVVERDPLPDEPAVRRGVPQAHHVHALHEACRATLEDLFPGYTRDVTDAGGLELDMTSDVDLYAEGDYAAEGHEDLDWYCASRPLFEHLVRRRVADHDRIRLRDDRQVTTLLHDDDRGAVTGVRIRDPDGATEERAAALVVDATGRTSRTPRWLESHGYPAPPLDEVTIDLAYTSLQLDRDSDAHTATIAMPAPPKKRGGAIFPVEDERWLVTLAGLHGDHPPTERDGLTDYAADVPAAAFEELLEERDAVGDPFHHPFPSSRRHRYWALDRFPDGLVVVGDAVASYNPIYGQGMSVAALEAVHLHHALAADRDTLPRRFFDRVRPVVDDAWNIAVGGDFRFPETEGPKPPATDLLNRYGARFTRKAHSDPVLADAFARVVRMERRPSSLLHPRILWRVLKPEL